MNHSSGCPGIIEAVAVPHPPLIVPMVGRGQERAVQDTIDAYETVAARIAEANPDVLIVTSPHAPLYRDGFFISDATTVQGDMSRFGAPDTRIDMSGDPVLAQRIAEIVDADGIPVVLESRAQRSFRSLSMDDGIDHGTFVPLHFLQQHLPRTPVVRIGLSGLGPEDHERLGRAITSALAEQDKRAVFVASGDLSHKLKEDGPYGFDPAGPRFGQRIGEIFDAGDLDALFTMDPVLCDDAAECGLRSFQIMAGALAEQARRSGQTFEGELMSLEGPFGVGYAVARFVPSDVDSRSSAGVLGVSEEEIVDPIVGLARASVEGYVRDGCPITRPHGLPEELLSEKAGVFVSLHEGDDLRGCIGTIEAVRECIADEIIANGIAACSHDPRFEPVHERELDFLSYSVDVLSAPEPIESPEDLDPSRYGVIVTQGWRRGLLLPNLDGVETVAQQVAIAKQKAGISPFDENVELERFEVVRHTKGGEARR